MPGVVVRLERDTDGDGDGDTLVATDTTSSAGRYGFVVPPGCFELRFTIPSGRSVEAGRATDRFCVNAGQDRADADLLLYSDSVTPPPRCEVQVGYGRLDGVEITLTNGRRAPSYTFYNRDGGVLHRTADFGPPDDFELGNVEWTADGFGYDPAPVWSVAAEDSQGIPSKRVVCARP